MPTYHFNPKLKIMKNITLIFCITLCTTLSLFSQDGEVLCVDINTINPEGYDIFSSYPDYDPDLIMLVGEPSNCYYLGGENLIISNNPNCCGEYTLSLIHI